MENSLDIPEYWESISLVEDFYYIPTGVQEYKGKKEYYSTGSIKGNEYNPEGKYSFDERPSRANRLVEANDVLQARMKGTNKALLIDKNLDSSLFSTGFLQVRPYGDTYVSKLLYYYLYSSVFLKEKDELCSGSTQSALNDTNAKILRVPLPPFNEQKRIVEKIETLFSELDSGIESLKAAKAQLKRYRQSVLKSAFEGKLTEAWRKEYADELESAKTLLERIKVERDTAYEKKLTEWKEAVKVWEDGGKEGKKPVKPKKLKELPSLSDEELAELPELPEIWKWAKTNHIALETILGKMLDKQKNKGELKPYLRNINVRWNSFDLSDLYEMRFEEGEEERYGLKKGDIVICEGGEPGRCAIWNDEDSDIRIQKALHRMRLPLGLVDDRFVYYSILFSSQTGRIENFFTGTTIKHLTGTGLAQFELPLCSTTEQNQIVNEIESRFSEADAMEKAIDESLKKAEHLRQSILKKAFEGKLVAQDANDEPALELLKRIKKDK